MPIAKIDGLDINYEIIGDSGPFVALVTGGRRGYTELISLGHKIAANGYRVLLHDRRNTGASSMRIEGGQQVEEITWADDLRELLSQHDGLPAFVGGSSAGARTAILFASRHPDVVRGLLLLRVTGGEFAAGRLPENYYGQFIRAAEEGGMAAVCATEQYRERMNANPASEEYLRNLDPQQFIDVMSRLRELFIAGAHTPVMGVTNEQLAAITAPTIVIPGNDKTHNSESGRIAHQRIPGSKIHELPIEDMDLDLVPFDEWAPHEEEICKVFSDFMKSVD